MKSPGSEVLSQTSQFATFYIDTMMFGIDVQKVQEIIRYQQMTPVPLSPDTVSGLINLRGQIITAIDLRRRIGLGDRDREKLPMNVVVHTSDGTVSLLVDKIGDVLEVSSAQYEETPDTLSGPTHDLVEGVYKLPGQLLLVLNAERAVEVQPSNL